METLDDATARLKGRLPVSDSVSMPAALIAYQAGQLKAENEIATLKQQRDDLMAYAFRDGGDRQAEIGRRRSAGGDRQAEIGDDALAVEQACEAINVAHHGLAAERERSVRLAEALDKLARLGNEPCYGNSTGNMIAREALSEPSTAALLRRRKAEKAVIRTWSVFQRELAGCKILGIADDDGNHYDEAVETLRALDAETGATEEE